MLTYKLSVIPSKDIFFNNMCTHLNDDISIYMEIKMLI